jgi:hypothetical protein
MTDDPKTYIEVISPAADVAVGMYSRVTPRSPAGAAAPQRPHPTALRPAGAATRRWFSSAAMARSGVMPAGAPTVWTVTG